MIMRADRCLRFPFILLLAASAVSAAADEVRYFQQNGVTYRETRRTIRRPVYQTEMRSTTRTAYRPEQTTQSRQVTQTRWTPVTECCWEPVWVGRWNPFVDPYLVYRPVTRTRWEASQETVERPQTVTRWVPETTTVEVPVTVRKMVPEDVVSRVAVSTGAPRAPAGGSGGRLAPVPRPAAGVPVGGVARLESDPPRQGPRTAWRPSTVR
ncbi:MAG: hypothetical protein ACOC46_00750 [Pirellulales bacterium]